MRRDLVNGLCRSLAKCARMSGFTYVEGNNRYMYMWDENWYFLITEHKNGELEICAALILTSNFGNQKLFNTVHAVQAIPTKKNNRERTKMSKGAQRVTTARMCSRVQRRPEGKERRWGLTAGRGQRTYGPRCLSSWKPRRVGRMC